MSARASAQKLKALATGVKARKVQHFLFECNYVRSGRVTGESLTVGATSAFSASQSSFSHVAANLSTVHTSKSDAAENTAQRLCFEVGFEGFA